jgi:hypothetical protein
MLENSAPYKPELSKAGSRRVVAAVELDVFNNDSISMT